MIADTYARAFNCLMERPRWQRIAVVPIAVPLYYLACRPVLSVAATVRLVLYVALRQGTDQ